MRAHSRKELKQRLVEKGYALEAARRALDRLQEVGLQSDAEFAEVFARSKWRQSKWSAGKISSVRARAHRPRLVCWGLYGGGWTMGEGVRQCYTRPGPGRHVPAAPPPDGARILTPSPRPPHLGPTSTAPGADAARRGL
jgi:hypothetical protein